MKKFTAITISILLIFSCFSNSYAITPDSVFQPKESFSIPAEFGFISDSFIRSDKQLVILVQDLHNDKKIQDHIKDIVADIDKNHGFSNIFIEGLYNKPIWIAEENSAKTADIMFEKSYLSGAEYYALLSGNLEKMLPLENKELYKNNIQRLAYLILLEDKVNVQLSKMDKIINSAKNSKYSSENKKIDTLVNKYGSGKISQKKFYLRLNKYIERTNLSDTPSIRNYYTFLKAKEVNHKKFSKELSSLMNDLKNIISYSEYSKFAGKISTNEIFGDDIEKICAKYNINLKKYKEIENYIKTNKIVNGFNVFDFADEEKYLIRELKIKYSKTKEERLLVVLDDLYWYYKDFLTNKLTEDGYYYLKDFGIDNFVNLWISFLKNKDIYDLTSLHKYFDEYNSSNLYRSQILIQHILQTRETTDGNIIAVMGGFHTREVAEYLKAKDISYVVITPSLSAGVNNRQNSLYKENVLRSIDIQYNAIPAESVLNEASVQEDLTTSMISDARTELPQPYAQDKPLFNKLSLDLKKVVSVFDKNKNNAAQGTSNIQKELRHFLDKAISYADKKDSDYAQMLNAFFEQNTNKRIDIKKTIAHNDHFGNKTLVFTIDEKTYFIEIGAEKSISQEVQAEFKKFIEENYDFAVSKIEHLSGGSRNSEIFLVTADSGKKYVFKRLHHDSQYAEYIAKMQDTLNENKMAVPAVHKNSDGKLITEKSGNFYSLEDFISEGKEVSYLDLTQSHYITIAEFAAEMHNFLGNADIGSFDKAKPKPRMDEAVSKLKKEFAEHIEDLLAKNNRNSVEDFILKSANFLNAQIEKFESNYDVKGLREVDSHMDMSYRNAMFDENDKVSIFDFGIAQKDIRPLVFDDLFFTLVEGRYGSPYKYANYNVIANTLKAYNDKLNEKLSDREIKAIVESLRARLINWALARNILNYNMLCSVYVNPKSIYFVEDNINYFKQFDKDFSDENVEKLIDYVLDNKENNQLPSSPAAAPNKTTTDIITRIIANVIPVFTFTKNIVLKIHHAVRNTSIATDNPLTKEQIEQEYEDLKLSESVKKQIEDIKHNHTQNGKININNSFIQNLKDIKNPKDGKRYDSLLTYYKTKIILSKIIGFETEIIDYGYENNNDYVIYVSLPEGQNLPDNISMDFISTKRPAGIKRPNYYHATPYASEILLSKKLNAHQAIGYTGIGFRADMEGVQEYRSIQREAYDRSSKERGVPDIRKDLKEPALKDLGVVLGFSGEFENMGRWKSGGISYIDMSKHPDPDNAFYNILGNSSGNLSEIGFRSEEDAIRLLQYLQERNMNFPKGISVRITNKEKDEYIYGRNWKLKDYMKELETRINLSAQTKSAMNDNKHTDRIQEEVLDNTVEDAQEQEIKTLFNNNFSKYGKIQSLTPLSGGLSIRQPYLINTDSGKYVLKPMQKVKIPRESPPEERNADYLTTMVSQLKENGVPANEIYGYADDGDYFMLLTEYFDPSVHISVSGSEMKQNSGYFKTIGEMLAKIHSLEAGELENAGAKNAWDMFFTINNILDNADAKINALKKQLTAIKNYSPQDNSKVETLMREQYKLLKENFYNINEKNLKKAHIHADFQNLNIFFNKGGDISGIIDFDQLTYNYRVTEFILPIIGGDNHAGLYTRENLKTLLMSYGSLNADEIRMTIELLRAMQIMFTTWAPKIEAGFYDEFLKFADDFSSEEKISGFVNEVLSEPEHKIEHLNIFNKAKFATLSILNKILNFFGYNNAKETKPNINSSAVINRLENLSKAYNNFLKNRDIDNKQEMELQALDLINELNERAKQSSDYLKTLEELANDANKELLSLSAAYELALFKSNNTIKIKVINKNPADNRRNDISSTFTFTGEKFQERSLSDVIDTIDKMPPKYFINKFQTDKNAYDNIRDIINSKNAESAFEFLKQSNDLNLAFYVFAHFQDNIELITNVLNSEYVNSKIRLYAYVKAKTLDLDVSDDITGNLLKYSELLIKNEMVVKPDQSNLSAFNAFLENDLFRNEIFVSYHAAIILYIQSIFPDKKISRSVFEKIIKAQVIKNYNGSGDGNLTYGEEHLFANNRFANISAHELGHNLLREAGLVFYYNNDFSKKYFFKFERVVHEFYAQLLAHIFINGNDFGTEEIDKKCKNQFSGLKFQYESKEQYDGNYKYNFNKRSEHLGGYSLLYMLNGLLDLSDNDNAAHLAKAIENITIDYMNNTQNVNEHIVYDYTIQLLKEYGRIASYDVSKAIEYLENTRPVSTGNETIWLFPKIDGIPIAYKPNPLIQNFKNSLAYTKEQSLYPAIDENAIDKNLKPAMISNYSQYTDILSAS